MQKQIYSKNTSSCVAYLPYLESNQQWVHVSGTKGYLQCDDFVLPWFGSDVSFEVNNAVYEIMGSDFNMNPRFTKHNVQEYSNSFSNTQDASLFRNFAQQVLSGESDAEWPEYALKTQ